MKTKRISLPGEILSSSEKLIMTPTMNRWSNKNNQTQGGSLIKLIESINSTNLNDGQTAMIISDQSDQAERENGVSKLSNIDLPTFLLTPESQSEVVALVSARTGIRKKIIEAILSNSGYASQRAKLDAVVNGLYLANGKARKVLSLDDDIVIPQKAERLIHPGQENYTNSQIVIPEHVYSDFAKIESENNPREIFDYLGANIDQLNSKSGINTSPEMFDDMHTKVSQATDSHFPIFTVDANPKLNSIKKAEVLAVTVTKSHIPDYRTVEIAKSSLTKNFPDQEMPLISRPVGQNRLFAFQKSHTNVDSACLSRIINDNTVNMPWWFVTSLDISAENPLRTVNSHYRADNEFLPKLIENISENTGKNYVYLGGTNVHMLHHRERSGYRPDIIEQAASSLIGNIAATEALSRMRVYGEKTEVSFGENSFKLDEEKARKVFEEFLSLRSICLKKITEIESSLPKLVNGSLKKQQQLLIKYQSVLAQLSQKTANFKFDIFYTHLNNEIRSQLSFYFETLKAMPIVSQEVAKLIVEGKYKVLQVVK